MSAAFSSVMFGKHPFGFFKHIFRGREFAGPKPRFPDKNLIENSIHTLKSALQLFSISKSNVLLVAIILFSTFVSSRFVYNYAIYPNVKDRVEFEQTILTGKIRAPYQYRVFKPFVGTMIQKIITPFISDPGKRHMFSYEIMIFAAFAGIYTSFAMYLRLQNSILSTVIGIMLLVALIPNSLTGGWHEGDYFNLFFFAFGILLFSKNKDRFLPLVFLIGAFNREQMIFLNVFYLIYLVSEKKLWTRRGIGILILNTAAYLIVFSGLRLYFGYKPTEYTAVFNASENIARFGVIIRLWTEMFAVFFILSLAAFRKSSLFLKLSFLSLGIYFLLFFHFGFLYEMAKFLPAYLILIPMCLKFMSICLTEAKSDQPKLKLTGISK